MLLAKSAAVDRVSAAGRRLPIFLLHQEWSRGLTDSAKAPNPLLRYGAANMATADIQPSCNSANVEPPRFTDPIVIDVRGVAAVCHAALPVSLLRLWGESVFIGSETARRAISVRRSDWQRYAESLDLNKKEGVTHTRPQSATQASDEALHAKKRQDLRDILRLMLQPDADTVFETAVRAGLQIPPGIDVWGFQRKGIAWIVESAHLLSDLEDDPEDLGARHRYGRLIADEMGMGKTIQAIAAMVYLIREGKIRHTIVVTPKSVVKQWQREIERWGPQLKVTEISGSATVRAAAWKSDAHVSIVSYESFAKDYVDGSHGGPRCRTWDLVVADEAQKIKNPKTEKSRELKALPRKLSWALTGTPVENKTFDIASIFQFVCGDARLFADRNENEVGPEDEEVVAIRRMVMLRRRIDDHMEDTLPPLTRQDIPVEIGAAQQKEYDDRLAAALKDLEDFGEADEQQWNMKARGHITRLLQICNSTIEGPPDSSKSEVLLEEMEELLASGRKALVFSKFRNGPAGIAALAERLRKGGVKTALYHGGTSQTERSRLSLAFGPVDLRPAEMNAIADDEPQVLCLIFQAGSTGLNLQGANYVFLYDPWWNPAVESQAIGRAYRQGQRFPVTAMRLIATGTVEERVVEVLARKTAEAAIVVDHDRELEEHDHLERIFQSFSSADYRDVFGLTDRPRQASRGKGAAERVLRRREQAGGLAEASRIVPSAATAREGIAVAPSDQGWKDFEERCRLAAVALGWSDARLTARGGDGGLDVIGSRPPGRGPEFIGMQAKRWNKRVGASHVRNLHGVRDNWGLQRERSRIVLVSSAGFTREAVAEAKVYGIELWGEEELERALESRGDPFTS
jgi:superfamily II DNA or RNA helicase